MNGSELKALWRSGVPSFGTWITLADPAICGIMANIGFDWIVLDGEHSPFNPETLRTMLLILRDRDVVAIVRVRHNDAAIVKQALDWGAEGIMFPMINTAEDARRAVAACRYPPSGIRGFSPREASNFWKNLDLYMDTANDRLVSILQVEHVEAVNNLDNIVAVPGIDALMIGPADLSFSLGMPLKQDQPLMQQTIDSVIRKARAAGIPVGMAWYDTAEGYKHYLERGLTFVALGDDASFMGSAGAALLSKMREGTGR